MKSKKLLFFIPFIFIVFVLISAQQIPRRSKRFSRQGLISSLSQDGCEKRSFSRPKDHAKYLPDQILVKFKPKMTAQSIETTLASYQVTVLKKIPRVNIHVVKIPENTTVAEMLYILRQNYTVESAGPNYLAYITESTNDPFFSYQYALENTGQQIGSIPGSPHGTERADIKATAAWEETKGEAEVIIAVIDTGIDFQHPDLVNKIQNGGYDFINSDDDPTDDNFHGTFVSGIAAAETNNGEGIAGVAWNCMVLPLKAFDDTGSGPYSAIIDAIVYAADNGADVINISAGGPDDPSLESAVEYAHNLGVLIVASAGNDSEPVLFPAAYDDYCLAVAATDYDDNRAVWSNLGPEIDVAAPGESILGPAPLWYFGDGSLPYGFGDGTSMAAPHVAGLGALIKSLKPWLTVDEIMDVIRFSADDINSVDFPGKDDYIGYGRINMEKALVPIIISQWEQR